MTRFFAIALLACAALPTLAETPAEAPVRFFKLELVTREMDGARIVNARTYALQASNKGSPATVNTNSQVMVGAPQATTTVSVGLHLSARILDVDNEKVSLDLRVDLSSLPTEQVNSQGQPTVRQNTWSSQVTVAIDRPTIVFASDDSTSKHVMQVQLTATPVK